MGRSKTKLNKEKGEGRSNSPLAIPLPHDGPIFHYHKKSNNHNASLSTSSPSLQASLSRLNSENNEGGAIGLVTNLQNASSCKQQVQILQTYRSTIMQQQQHQEQNGSDHHDTTDSNKSRKKSSDVMEPGDFRLLLEWMLSDKTPVQLQRCILSVLNSVQIIAQYADYYKEQIISQEVIQSILISITANNYWNNPLRSLEIAVSLPFNPDSNLNLVKILKTLPNLDDCFKFLYRNKIFRCLSNESLRPKDGPSNNENFVNDHAVILKILTKLLQQNENPIRIPYQDDYERYLLMLFRSPHIPIDTYTTLGIIYGNLRSARVFENTRTDDDKVCDTKIKMMAENVINLTESLYGDDDSSPYKNLSHSARLSIVQGIAATFDLPILLCTCSSISPLECCWKYCLRESQVATDPMVRWCALKGLTTMVARWKSSPSSSASCNDNFGALIQDTLVVTLQTWENPPLRKLAKAIPGLFTTLVQLLDEKQILLLCDEVMHQPKNRKGKYLSLKVLLPYIAKDDAWMSSSSSLLSTETLLKGIGDRGPNTIPMADLWIQVLEQLWEKYSKNKNAEGLMFKEWTSHWIPSLALALVTSPELARRKQIAAFCIPRIVDFMKRNKNLKPSVTRVFVMIFSEINDIRAKTFSMTSSRESICEHTLWAHLELARHTSLHKLTSDNTDMQVCIATHIPLDILRLALTHSKSSIRLVAFQSLEPLCSALSSVHHKAEIELEMEMWEFAFPCASKTTENKDYTSSLLQYLSSFLDRFSLWEAKLCHNIQQSLSANSDGRWDQNVLPKVYSFLSQFLLQDVALAKGGYPGTIADKECFTLLLLNCILAFVTQDQFYTDENSVGRNSTLFQRRRETTEVATMNLVLDDILACETFSTFFALLQSAWDPTRVSASRSLSKFVLAAQAKSRRLPEEFSSDEARACWLARAVHLCSSPRQREADTGARIIAFLYASKETDGERHDFLKTLEDLLRKRISSMKLSLQSLLRVETFVDPGEEQLNRGSTGSELPLAHGLIHAIRLSIKHHDHLSKRQRNSKCSSTDATVSLRDQYDRLVHIFCQGIQLSLAVVADVQDGEILQGMEDQVLSGNASIEYMGSSEDGSGGATPLNVNTGAIGSNGAFAKLDEVDEIETNGRLALQRVIVGTWLLIKESCEAMASVIIAADSKVPVALVSKVGTLLITTLTSLKHAGAAFAARDSLQTIATFCLSRKSEDDLKLQELPEIWAKRLLSEISANEKVRDSTLRRSTGYALGLVALIRSEISSKITLLSICPLVLHSLLIYAQPPEQELAETFVKLGLSSRGSFDAADFFCERSISSFQTSGLVGDYDVSACVSLPILYQLHAFSNIVVAKPRCRVHALNVLRLVILDAPIASAVQPYIGDAIISSIVGYNDKLWGVRNSSTMVFSAAMLRVVDADKNASNLDSTSSSAITINELFRRYPPLSSFLLATLQFATRETPSQDETDSQAFPVLLLLSRVHPVSSSGDTASTLIEHFPSVVCKSLSSRNHTVRDAAARALANICTENDNTPSSPNVILLQLKKLVEKSLNDTVCDWNFVDGVLLGIFALISNSKSARTALQQIGLESLLLRVLMPTERTQICPPSSMATALKTVIVLCADDGFNISQAKVSSICKTIVSKRELESLIGGSALLSTAAVAYCRLLQRHVWSPDTEEQLRLAINEMESMLSSTLFDVKLAAGKCFKNGICNNIENLLDSSIAKEGDHSVGRERLLSLLARMLLRCMHVEVNLRDDVDGRMGPHLPTERRLSRCFLECFRGYCSVLGNTAADISSFLDDEMLATVESVSLGMIEHESMSRNTAEEEEEEINGETLLSSNAVEMLAIVVCRYLTKERSGEPIETGGSLQPLDSFIDLIRRLNNKDVSWRSRYNLAAAIAASQILNPNITVPNQYRQIFLFQVIEMLQDSDNDVRSSSGHTAMQFLTSRQQSYSVLPEIMLTKTYEAVCKYREAFVGETIIKTLLSNCRGILLTLKHVEDEFRETSNDCATVAELVNASTNRKIFEGGDYNPYQEQALENQLICRALIAMEGYWNFPNCFYKEIMSLCKAALEGLLGSSTGRGNMAHDMTHHPKVFPSLHSLVLGATIALYFGAQDTTTMMDVQDAARRLLKYTNSVFFHPDILLVLTNLGQAVKGSLSTKEKIASSLFLLRVNNGET